MLVTLVSGLIFGDPFDDGNPNAKNGLYRIERDGTAKRTAAYVVNHAGYLPSQTTLGQ